MTAAVVNEEGEDDKEREDECNGREAGKDEQSLRDKGRVGREGLEKRGKKESIPFTKTTV